MNDGISRLFRCQEENAAEYYCQVVDFFLIQLSASSRWKHTKSLLEFNNNLIQYQSMYY